MSEDLTTLISDLKEQKALAVAKQRLESGDDPFGILLDSKKAMEIVGLRFSEGTYFLPDLVYSGQILAKISEMLKPQLSTTKSPSHLGKFVIGSVKGDLHDIGKNLVAFMLEVNGFEVLDLGVDVAPQVFVEKIVEVEARIVGLSGFLTSIYHSMKETVDAIEAHGLRDKVKIMIGGGVIDEKVCRFCGADAYRPDAMAAVDLAKQWLGGI